MDAKKMLSNLSVLVILSVAGFLLIANFLHMIYLTKTFEVNIDEIVPNRTELIDRIENRTNIIKEGNLGFDDDEIIISSVEKAYDEFFSNPIIDLENKIELNFKDLIQFDEMTIAIYIIPSIYSALDENGLDTNIYFQNYALNRISRQNIVFDDGSTNLKTHTYKMPSRSGHYNNYAAEARIYMFYACLSEFDLALNTIIREAGLDAWIFDGQ